MTSCRLRALRAATLALVVCTACRAQVKVKTGSDAEQRAIALVALDSLHRRYSDGRLEDIYTHMTVALRSHPKAELMANMRETRSRWGKFVSANVVASACFPNEVRFIVASKYEHGQAVEVVTWALTGEAAYIQDFQIFPGPLDSVPAPGNECRSRP